MRVETSKEAFLEAAGHAAIVALTAEISADMETPVSIYNKVVGETDGFILESVDVHQNFGRFSFIGARPFATVRAFKGHLEIDEDGSAYTIEGAPLKALSMYLKKFQHMASTGIPLADGGAVGYFSYEAAATMERVRGLHLSEDQVLGQFMLCRILIVLDHLKHTAKLIYLCRADSGKDGEELYGEALGCLKAIKEQLSGMQRTEKREARRSAHLVSFATKCESARQGFIDMVEAAKEHIVAGDLFQVVLSKQFCCKLHRPPFEYYRRLRQVNPSPYMFYLSFGARKVVGASPEMLVKVVQNTIYTYPIAGTRPRGTTMEEDAKLADELKKDEKECAEHAMLVDLGRNDIGRVSQAGTVRVTKQMEIEKFSHVMHMVSEVQGKIDPRFAPLDALGACFPAGTVSGAPKARAMEIIHDLERKPREIYAGCVGYVDFCGNLDMCIAIRSIRIDGDQAVVQTGAGVVADSIPEKEYREILQKAKVLFQVIEEVENDAFIVG